MSCLMISFLSHLKEPKLNKVSSRQELYFRIRSNPLRKVNLESVAKKFKFSNKQAAAIGGFALRTYQRRKPSTALSVQASESLLKLAEVYDTGMKAFNNDEQAFMEWLKTPIPALKNKVPVEMLTSAMGSELVNQELLRIEYAIFS